MDAGKALGQRIGELLGPLRENPRFDVEYLESVGGEGENEQV